MFGGLAGFAVGLLAAWRASLEGEPLGMSAVARFAAPAVIGTFVAALLVVLRPLRTHSLLGHYVAWMFSCVGAMAGVGVVAWVFEGTLEFVWVFAGIGTLFGAGLGAFARFLEGQMKR